MRNRISFIVGSIVTIVCIGLLYAYVAHKWTRITIQAQDQPVSFFVEKAITPEQRERGLMFRKSLGANKGMLFLFEKPLVIRMWMKDTLIPLDMVFINGNKVVSIYQNAKPKDLAVISSKVFATGVLEINAGMVQKYRIRVGDRISF